MEGPLGLVESPGVTGHVVHENTEIAASGSSVPPVLIVEILLERF